MKTHPLNPQKRHKTELRFETLESRNMLAGDVTVSVQGDDLTAEGDTEDNSILVTQPVAGTIRIAGIDGTTVNGQKVLEMPMVAGDLSFLMMQGGDDKVSLQGTFAAAAGVTGKLAAGEFLLEGTAGPLHIAGDLDVRVGHKGLATLRNEVRIDGATMIDAGEVSVIAARGTVPDFAAAQFSNSLKINNPYFPLVVGTTYTYEAETIDDETGEITHEEIIVEVLPETRTILGVEVRVVRDRVFEEGVLIEDTFDWYAQDNNGNVWYFGEDVTNYEYDEQGNLIDVNNDGSWGAGVDNSVAGIIMEAKPRVGHRYYQEFSPDNVLDYGEGLSTNKKVTVPTGTYTRVFKTEEGSVMEPAGLANKFYAPGIGTIAELDLDIEDNEVVQTTRLVSLTLNGQPVKQLVPTKGFSGVNSGGRFVGGAELGGAADVSAEGPVVINGATFADALTAEVGDEPIVLVDTSVAGDVSIDAEDTVSLKNVTAAAMLEVMGKLDDLFIEDSEIEKLSAKFGGGDDVVTVRNSVFAEFFADGGAGKNTFEDLGHNEFGNLKLKRFMRR